MSTVEMLYPMSPAELKRSRKMFGIPANLDQFNALVCAIEKYKAVNKTNFEQQEIRRRLGEKSLIAYDKMTKEIENMARLEAYNAIFEAAKAFVETCDPADLIVSKP